ncbi:AMP-binding protein [Sporichthya polymorpha]|uniref:AMP-binding protein n=1 Tax=Sporichthya polymorpha TaxID=35751 RepID=UPI00039D6A30|nr:AMP-binding protein [Sporichthya polymorpha]
MSLSYVEADRSVELRDISVGGVLREAAAEVPDAPALVNGAADPAERRRWTYAELLAAAENVAARLLEHLEPGERLAIWSVNLAEWELVQFGAALAGIPVVAINPAYTAAELEYVLGQSGSVAIVLGPPYRGTDPAAELAKVRDRLPALRATFTLDADSALFAPGPAATLPDVDPSSLAMMQYTSGTTGRPKGAMLSHRSLCNNSRLFNRRLGLDGAGSWVNAMPMFHIGGSSFGAIGSMWSRAAHIITTFDPALMLELIETERPAFLPSVPTMLLAMSEHPDFAKRDHSSIQVIMAGSTTIPAELIRRVEKEWGANFVPCYGQTECSGVIVQGMPTDSPEDKSAWAGRPLEQVEVRVVDPGTGQVVPHGEVGEFHVRGYTTMDGYFGMPAETAATLDADGWLRTGDLGVMDPRGYCQVTGRLKDMIIRGGENIYPREIEDRLVEHPAISEVAVIGVPDERMGEEVAAVVRLAPGTEPDPESWRAFAREALAGPKVPRRWFVVDAMPTTPSGKIQKFRLPEVLTDPAAARDVTPPRTP